MDGLTQFSIIRNSLARTHIENTEKLFTKGMKSKMGCTRTSTGTYEATYGVNLGRVRISTPTLFYSYLAHNSDPLSSA